MTTLKNLIENSELLNFWNLKFTQGNSVEAQRFVTNDNEVIMFPLYIIDGNTEAKYQKICLDVYATVAASIADFAERQSIYVYNPKHLDVHLHMVDENYIGVMVNYNQPVEVQILELEIKRSPLIKFLTNSAAFDPNLRGSSISFKLNDNIEWITNKVITQIATFLRIADISFYEGRNLYHTTCTTNLTFNVEVATINRTEKKLVVYYQIEKIED